VKKKKYNAFFLKVKKLSSKKEKKRFATARGKDVNGLAATLDEILGKI